jgi:hypothetical protein
MGFPILAVTDPQWAALIKLCAWLSLVGNFQSSSIEGHQHFVDTACPGRLMEHLERLRHEVRDEKLRLMEEAA